MSRQVVGNNDGQLSAGTPSKLTDLPSTGAGFSACIWCKRLGDGGTGSTSRGDPFDKLNAAGTVGWSLRVTNSGAGTANAIQYAEARATSAKVRTSAASVITNNVWFFLALTVAAGTTAADVHIYKGSPGGAVAEVSYSATTNGVGTYSTDSAVAQGIGTRIAAVGSDWFNGYLAEGRLFANKILSLTELQGLMNGTPYQPPATAYWPLYGAVPAPDLTVSAANATLGGTGAIGPNPPTCAPWAIR